MLRKVLLKLGVVALIIVFQSLSDGHADQVDTTRLPKSRSDKQSFVLEIDVNLVVLNITVVDENQGNVTSLTKNDFLIYEDGIRQDIANFFPVEAPFKLVLVVDTSISTRKNLSLIKTAAGNFAKELRPKDEIALAETHFFSQEVQGFTNDRKILRKAIKRLSTYPYGGSRVYDGMAMALRSLQPIKGGRKAIVVLSDGMENSSNINFDELQKLFAKENAVLYPITIVNKDRQKAILENYIHQHKNEIENPYVKNARVSLSVLEEVYKIQIERLNQLSSQTGGKIFLVNDLSDLSGEYSNVAHELRNTFSLAYYSNNKASQGGMRKIRVEVGNPKFQVRTRSGYYVPEVKLPVF